MCQKVGLACPPFFLAGQSNRYFLSACDLPQRIVLRFHVKFEREERAIIDTFFELHGPDPIPDYYSHLCPPNESSKMHIVLDLRCKTFPAVDLRAIEHKVFKVRKSDTLYVSPFPPLSTHSAKSGKLAISSN